MKNRITLRILIRIIACVVGLLTMIMGYSQKGLLTLEDLYGKNIYSAKGYGPVKWYKDGEGYTTLEQSLTNTSRDIVLYRPESGDRTVLVPSSELIPDGSVDPLSIRDYQWSEDGNYLMVFTNTRRVWRLHTRGDYWVLNLSTEKLTQLGTTLPATSLQFAKFAPNSTQVAYVSGKNIYVEDLVTGNIDQLTHDGGGHIINGTFDWAYEEEFNLRDGFRWSPDNKRIAFWQINTEGVGTFYMINNIDSIYPEIVPFAYPKVGTTNPEARIGVISLDDDRITWMQIEGDKRNNYLARMEWANSEKELIIQQINRRQNINRIILANAITGDSQVIFVEEVETWLDVYDDLTWLDEGDYFTWNSDKTGWMHFYLVSRDGKDIQQVTKGDYEVIQLLSVDEKNGYAYFIAAPDDPIRRYLYRKKINGKGKAEKVTPEGEKGHHSYNITPDNRYAIHTFSNHITPPIIELISLKGHKTIRILEDNIELKERFNGLDINPKKFFRIALENGTKLDGWIIKPPDFDPKKKYPVIFHVYGEPMGTTVQDRWSGGDLWHYFLSQNGYIVMSVDNRGTNVPRGRAWRKSIYKQIGIQASHDQAAVAKQIIEWDFIDKERIGIWGWSGGGSMTLNCMFRFPDTYNTGIAIAFVSNQKLYDSFYQERFMGLPEENEYGYREGSPITHAKNLEGNLLLIHGSADDNCHYQSLEMLVNELIKHNRCFTMIEYPMRTHAIRERENTSLHLRHSMYQYFLKNLPPGGK